jgi:hypothetical protein
MGNSQGGDKVGYQRRASRRSSQKKCGGLWFTICTSGTHTHPTGQTRGRSPHMYTSANAPKATESVGICARRQWVYTARI